MLTLGIMSSMSFMRVALVAVGGALIAGGAYGYWQYRQAPLQTADITTALTASAPQLIVGTWTSADDPAYRVTFQPDGALVESYDGEVVSTGRFSFAATPAGYVTEGEEVPTGAPHEFLLEDIDGEKYAYRVMTVSASALQLAYLDRGNTLSFTR